MKKETVIAWIVGIIIFAIVIIFSTHNVKSTPVPPPPVSVSLSGAQLLENASKCAADGSDFFKFWTGNMVQEGWRYDAPQYHYNQKLNTCLALVAQTSPFNDSPMIGTSRIMDVYDVYSNKIVLQSDVYRYCGDGTACKEVVQHSLDHTMVNLSTDDFNAQAQTVMSQ